VDGDILGKWQSSHNAASLKGGSAWGEKIEGGSASSFEGRGSDFILIFEAAGKSRKSGELNRYLRTGNGHTAMGSRDPWAAGGGGRQAGGAMGAVSHAPLTVTTSGNIYSI
jgi:hypothetical protein